MRIIYRNGAVYTGELPLCEAFVTEDGRFVYAGTNEGAMAFKEEGDGIRELKGRFVCAGFNDSHMHLLNYGNALRMADLSAHTKSMGGMKEYMKDFIIISGRRPGSRAGDGTMITLRTAGVSLTAMTWTGYQWNIPFA